MPRPRAWAAALSRASGRCLRPVRVDPGASPAHFDVVADLAACVEKASATSSVTPCGRWQGGPAARCSRACVWRSRRRVRAVTGPSSRSRGKSQSSANQAERRRQGRGRCLDRSPHRAGMSRRGRPGPAGGGRHLQVGVVVVVEHRTCVLVVGCGRVSWAGVLGAESAGLVGVAAPALAVDRVWTGSSWIVRWRRAVRRSRAPRRR